jgi:hypothetical protein
MRLPRLLPTALGVGLVLAGAAQPVQAWAVVGIGLKNRSKAAWTVDHADFRKEAAKPNDFRVVRPLPGEEGKSDVKVVLRPGQGVAVQSGEEHCELVFRVDPSDMPQWQHFFKLSDGKSELVFQVTVEGKSRQFTEMKCVGNAGLTEEQLHNVVTLDTKDRSVTIHADKVK